MTQTITKPTLTEVLELEDGTSFHSKRIGPTNFASLRIAKYKKGFRMPTLPELVPLIHAAVENQKYFGADRVIQALSKHGVAGDTAILHGECGIYVQDSPNMFNKEISMDEGSLDQFRHYEIGGINISRDGLVRWALYDDFKIGEMSPKELSRNAGIRAIVGGEENAEKLAEIASHYRKDPIFVCGNFSPENPEIKVPYLSRYITSSQFYIRAGAGVCESTFPIKNAPFNAVLEKPGDK